MDKNLDAAAEQCKLAFVPWRKAVINSDELSGRVCPKGFRCCFMTRVNTAYSWQKLLKEGVTFTMNLIKQYHNSGMQESLWIQCRGVVVGA